MRVLGYRAFIDRSEDRSGWFGEWTLGSVGYTMAPPWIAGLNHAECLAGGGNGSTLTTWAANGLESASDPSHRPGQPFCSCGFWALHDLHSAIQLFPQLIHAVVVGSGQVSIAERGWRAERAEIVALLRATPWVSPERLQALADRYGVAWIDAVTTLDHAAVARLQAGPDDLAWTIDEAKVARWVAEFGRSALDPGADWPRVPGSIPGMELLPWLAPYRHPLANPIFLQTHNPVQPPPAAPSFAVRRPIPRRRWFQWG